jgi:enoyl reductase-like protein
MDSVTMAQVMKREREVAKANCTYQWIRTSTKTLNQEMVRIAMGRYHDHNDEHVIAIMMRIQELLPPDRPRKQQECVEHVLTKP